MKTHDIRLLTLDDYDRIAELWRQSGLNSLRPEGRDSREAFERQLRRGQIVLGLERGGELLGVVLATHDTRKGWINRLAVHPAHRRKGYGRELQRAAETALRNAGIEVIAALIDRRNAESIALLEREGYQRAPDVLYFSKRAKPEA